MTPCKILLSNFELAVPYAVTDKDIIRAVREYQLGDGFCCWFDHMNGRQDLPETRPGEHMVVTFWPNNPYNRLRAAQRGLPVDEYVEWAFSQVTGKQKEMGERFFWCIGWEMFKDSLWCEEDGNPPILPNRRAAYEFYSRWVHTSLQTKCWRNTLKFGEDRFNRRPSVIEFLASRKIPPGKFNLMMGSTLAYQAHYAFKTLPELAAFWWECGITSLGLQAGIPYVRGAAVQYGRKWLADVSPYHYPYPLQPEEYYRDLGEWGGFEGGRDGRCRLNFPKYTQDMVRLAGYTPAMMLRCWMTVLMSGADYVFQEASSVSHFLNVAGRLELTPYGRNAARMAEFKRRLPESGKPVIPVALIVDTYHGMEPLPRSLNNNEARKPWNWCPGEKGDAQIVDFFETAYPKHSTLPEPAPWKDAREQGDMLRAGFDCRPFERRVLCDGRWPDMFNVYLADAGKTAFDDSRMIMLLGGHALTAEQENNLFNLVTEGKNLVLTAGQARHDSPLLDGLHSRPDRPQWLHRKHGSGQISFFSVPYGIDENGCLLRSYVAGLDILFAGLTPFLFSGPPIQRLINRASDGYILTLVNNSMHPWHGKISSKNLTVSAVLEFWDEQPVTWSADTNGVHIRLTVQPFGLKVLKITTAE